MSETKFVNGVIFKLPRPEAPDFVKGSISIKLDDLRQWLVENPQGDWLNIDLKVSKEGKAYASLNEWKPDSSKKAEVDDKGDESDLPF